MEKSFDDRRKKGKIYKRVENARLLRKGREIWGIKQGIREDTVVWKSPIER